MAAQGTILWDFDGTLVRHRGWGSALLAALTEIDSEHGVTPEHVRRHLRAGFPWHRPELPHPELNDPEAWWRRVGGILRATFVAAGYAEEQSETLARRARALYVDPASHLPFPEVGEVLKRLREDGWQHVVLSNHAPELQSIVRGIGLEPLFEAVLSSAHLGFEKPHPRSYEIARQHARPGTPLWMVGDNPTADVAGAEAAGIPAILVHAEDADVHRCAADLHGVRAWIRAGPAASQPSAAPV